MSRECSPRRPGPRCGSSLAGSVAAAWVAVVAGHQHPYPRYTPRVGTNPVFDVCNKDVIADMRERNERSGRPGPRCGSSLAGGVAAAWVAVVAGHQHPYSRYTPRIGTDPVLDE